jgi:sigma-B regulation protein RsbU (phosphoserine phosphatase)
MDESHPNACNDGTPNREQTSVKEKKSPILLYVCLGLLFLVAGGYQFRDAVSSFPVLFHQTTPAWPFQAVYMNGQPVASLLRPEAAHAGLSFGDVIIALNGRVFTGTAVFGDAIAAARPGDVFTVVVRTPSTDAERTISIPLQPEGKLIFTWSLALLLMLKLVLPVFCLLLGFWVAAVRPRDPSAWLLLLVLLGLSNFYRPGIEAWGRGYRDVAQAYLSVVEGGWSLFMFLFGIYFPEPFPDRDPAWWSWAKRIIIPALAVATAIYAILYTVEIENYALVARLDSVWSHFGKLAVALNMIAAGSFFICIQAKLRTPMSRDAKRRLQLLYFGATVSMTPVFLLVLTSIIRGRQIQELFPWWLYLSCFTLIFLFPVTLAYVIVVQRALNVRVVVRQGLQYGLATRGVRILQIAITAGVLLAAIQLMESHLSSPRKLSIIASLALIIFLLGRGAGRLRKWIDLRFFRDAYNAEQVLAGLSDEVRTMVETRPMLETVVMRIAESLHVPRIAVLLDEDGLFTPAYALGYANLPDASFADSAVTVRRLQQNPEPARVYLDDADSWVNSPTVSDGERQKLAVLAPQLLLPLAVKEKLLGIISLGEKRSEEPYSSSDLRLLKSVAVQTGLALSNAQLTAAIAIEVGRREKMSREIEIAREVQERLFPQKLPDAPGLDYFGRCRTALGVGGDYYDFLALPDGKLGVALGDISGKGIAAALMMASLQASLRAEAMRAGNDLASMITRVNQMIYDASGEDRYATLFYAQYDPVTRRLAYVNAGHNPPMLFRGAGGGQIIERLETGGPVVGLMPECAFEQAEVVLAPGDRLVIFTDGISEAMNPALEEWGEHRLIASVRALDGNSAEQSIVQITHAADSHVSGAPQHDDMTLVILRVLR